MAKEAWSRGDRYEPYIGRWSRLVGREFVEWIAPETGRRWLDVGCGTGSLSAVVLATAKPTSVIGVDPASGYVEYARAHVLDERVEFRVGDARELPVADASVDYVVCGLVLNFIPDPAAALAEMCRVAVSGGVIAGYVWDYGQGMQLIRRFWDAAIALDPAAVDLDEAARFPLCRPGALHQLFVDAGLADVRSRAIVVPTVFAGFEDYWIPFLGGEGPASGYCVALSDEAREQLRLSMRAALPVAPDGSIHLTARAWAVTATSR
ncbi:MAG: class I SAM-dependent methyltransferase [Pseudonocardiaceae bacterium]